MPSISVDRAERLVAAIVSPVVDALSGHCIDEDFDLDSHPTVRTAVARVVARALLADPIFVANDESLFRARGLISRGFRAYRLHPGDSHTYIFNFSSPTVLYSEDCAAEFWPGFSRECVLDLEYLTSLEG